MENEELMEKARAAKSAKELMSLAKENGVEMTEEEAQAYFSQLNKSGELADDELDSVAGGGCHSGGGKLVVTVGTQKDCFVCKHCGATAEKNFVPEGLMAITGYSHYCKGKNIISNCGNCKYCNYEKGLWVFNFSSRRQ